MHNSYYFNPIENKMIANTVFILFVFKAMS